jgi:hypothetical protein
MVETMPVVGLRPVEGEGQEELDTPTVRLAPPGMQGLLPAAPAARPPSTQPHLVRLQVEAAQEEFQQQKLKPQEAQEELAARLCLLVALLERLQMRVAWATHLSARDSEEQEEEAAEAGRLVEGQEEWEENTGAEAEAEARQPTQWGTQAQVGEARMALSSSSVTEESR